MVAQQELMAMQLSPHRTGLSAGQVVKVAVLLARLLELSALKAVVVTV